MHGKFIRVALHIERFTQGRFILRIAQVVEVMHSAQDVLLANLGAFRIDHRVVGRGRFGQTGQHGRFCRGQLVEGLAVVDLCRGGKTIGALAQIDLVDVELKDLVFGEILLDLECEQHFIQLAGDGFFRRQEEVTGHLHGDGRGALLLATGDQIGCGSAREAEYIHAGVLIEAIIFRRQDRLLHNVGDLIDLDDLTTLFAKLTDQRAIRGVDA